MNRAKWSDWFYYSEDSPSGLKWKVDRTRGFGNKVFVSAGDDVGSLGSDGYYRTCLLQKEYRCHRIVFELMTDVILSPDDVVDHIDGNKINNKITNLRSVTNQKNLTNSKMRIDNISGTTGVFRHQLISRNKLYSYWAAFWSENGKCRKKSFSINKLGENVAFELAVSVRRNAIIELNLLGQEYTERHGK